ncbi:hypothetical protein [Bordetella bronchialis]|uniref:hypothetical protein n=1 Tax=Bordetella bronchialis TaxID=463025 RepID=UPI0018D336EE|nr:hypothetical protein [Bordetella bronchialis]
MNSEIAMESLKEGIKAAPPVAVTAAVSTGWWSDPNHWLIAASLGYIALQTAYLIWKWRRQARDGIVEES